MTRSVTLDAAECLTGLRALSFARMHTPNLSVREYENFERLTERLGAGLPDRAAGDGKAVAQSSNAQAEARHRMPLPQATGSASGKD